MNTTPTNVRQTLPPLLSIALIMALFSFAQTFAASNDDFNDNIKDTSKWGTDRLVGGISSDFTETNQRLEYTCGRDSTRPDKRARPWILTQFPYNADWEIQIDTFNVTSPNLFFFGNGFGIDILSPHTPTDGVSAELYMSASRDGPVRRGFTSQLHTGGANAGLADSGDIGATNGAVRIAFDSATKVITVFYDKNVTDGYQWVDYGSFGIAGTGGANGNTNWGLTGGDQFSAFVYGRSAFQQILSGQMFGDNFMETRGVPSNGPPSFANISTRGRVETGDNVVIGGFIINGTQPKKVIVRAIGPSMNVNGAPVVGRLADPTLQLFDQRTNPATPIAYNDNWKDSQQTDIQSAGLAPSNDLESAILTTLDPGAYTAVMRGVNSTGGIALVEGYDLDQTVDSKFANISTRGYVQTGDNVMIGGLIIQGSSPAKVIVRAIGPSLTHAGIANPLQDPTLELHDGNGTSIISNDNWKDSYRGDIQATGLPPSNDLESAIVATLSPGAYTAIVRGRNNTSGVALFEAYQLGN
jgi:hypothetical protein